MRISKGNIGNVNKRILAGAIAFTFFTTKIFGYKVVKQIKYYHAKLQYTQTENSDVIIPNEYALIPEKTELNFFDETNVYKDNYKSRNNQLIKRRVLKRR